MGRAAMNEAPMKESKKLAIKLDEIYAHKALQEFGKIGIVDSWGYDEGGIYEHFLYKNIFCFIDLYKDFQDLRLEKFCAIVLPMGLDEVFLARFKSKILSYLDNGGVVLSFISDFMQILPHNSGYIQSPIPIREREIVIPDSPSAKRIFDGVREYDINFRRGVKGFFNRGYFDISGFSTKPEVFLSDNDNKCVGYIDRDSSNGIILATAGADLFSFGLFDNTTARRMGLNTLAWLESELKAKDLKALRLKALESSAQDSSLESTNLKSLLESSFIYVDTDKTTQSISRPTLKNAIITGGSSFHRYLFTNKNKKYANIFSRRIYFLELEAIDLNEFDYIVLASRLNDAYLLPLKQKFLDYLQSGGHIVSFGEIGADYLPNIAWKDYAVNFWWWLIDGADMPLYALESDNGALHKRSDKTTNGLFSKINVDGAKWHCHGAFYPPKNAERILVNELDESIIYKDTNFKGNLYITSLDPEFHLGQGFMPKTEWFFDAFIQWVEEDILR